MMKENIMSGRLPLPNDPPSIGTGFGVARMKEVLTPTIENGISVKRLIVIVLIYIIL